MKPFRKIRQTFIKEGNLKRYLLYAIGEILLVMIGISLAFQVNNWNDNRIKGNAEIRYYENIREQIADDKQQILFLVDFNKNYAEQFRYASELIETDNREQTDSMGLIVRKLMQYSDFDRQGNIYETMINSGQIRLLQNHEIINSIRTLEEKYLYINRMENIHYDAMMTHVIPSINPMLKFTDATIQKSESLFNYQFQNLIISLLQVMKEKDKVYNEALHEIEVITGLIDKELLN